AAALAGLRQRPVGLQHQRRARGDEGRCCPAGSWRLAGPAGSPRTHRRHAAADGHRAGGPLVSRRKPGLQTMSFIRSFSNPENLYVVALEDGINLMHRVKPPLASAWPKDGNNALMI